MYYEVKGTNLRIAGSMHLFPADSPQMPDWLWEAYKWSEHLVIESDPNGIRPYCSLPEGVSLSTILPASVNRAWMDSFRAAFNSPRRTLILVGAIHLCGEDSVIKLTEKEGHILSSLF